MSQKVLIVIGAGPGISLATAKKFGENGATVAFIARRPSSLEAFGAELDHHGIENQGFIGDAASADSLREALHKIIEHYGSVDSILYNVSAATPGKPLELNPEDIARDFQANVLGALVAVQEVVPHMTNGSLLFTGGGLALNPYPDYTSLAIGKAGLRNLVHSLYQQLQDQGHYVGMVTVKGFVKPGTFYDPKDIAEAFYTLYTNREQVEFMFEESK